MAKDKEGNAECIRCGLRASSKNVAIRNIFACHPKDKLEVAYADLFVRIIEEGDLTGFAIKNFGEFEGMDAIVAWLQDLVRVDPGLSYLGVILCDHEWKQDQGTATV